MLSALSVCSARRITIAGRSCLLALMLSNLGWAQETAAPNIETPEVSQTARKSTVEASQSDVANARGVSLAEVLSHAETHAPLLATAKARIGVARAGVEAEAPWFPQNPQLGVSLGSRSAAGNAGFQYQVSLAQKLEIAGERGLRRKAAQADEKVAQLSRDAARWQLHVEVHRLFNQLLLLSERRQQAERFVEFSESLQAIASGQVRAGEEAPLTLLVAESDVAQTKSVLLSIRQQESVTLTNLKGLIGWPQDQPLRADGTLPPPRGAPALSKLLELMAKHHPSLQVRREAVKAGHARLRAEKRQAWPKPTIGASYGREPGLGAADADIMLFNLTVPLPLWRRNQGGIAKAQAELDVVSSQQLEVRTRLEAELQAAATALNTAAAQVELYEERVIPRLEQNLTALQKAYELGEVGLLQVSQTRERLLDGSRRYLDARIEYFGARAALEGFVGTELQALGMEEK